MRTNALSRYCIIDTYKSIGLIALCVLFYAFPAKAQFTDGPYGTAKYKAPDKEVVDNAKLMAVYGHWMHDDVLDDNKYEDDILEIGKHCSLYSCYGWYRVDSLFNSRYPNGGTNMEYLSCATSIPSIKHLKYTFKNLKDSTINDKILIGFNYYNYSEPIQNIKWYITDEKATFQGISCIKATCHFRGRDWIAWFAPDIPISDGPWKFHGLPGLIIYISDVDRTHIFSLLDLRKPSENGKSHQIKIPKKDNVFPITREKALKRAYEVAMDPKLLIQEGYKGNIEIFGQRDFYAPLELE